MKLVTYHSRYAIRPSDKARHLLFIGVYTYGRGWFLDVFARRPFLRFARLP